MTWDDSVVSMKDTSPREPGEMPLLHGMMADYYTETLFADIQESTYDPADMKKVAQAQTHLTQEQRDDLEKIFMRHTTLFDGQLKKYTGGQVQLHVDPNVEPKAVRHYPVAQRHLHLFKQELDRLEGQDAIERCGRFDWISGTFVIPKKDGKVRVIIDLRALNKAIRRRVYPIPLISDLLRRRKGYKYLSKLDISMQYYTFDLN